MFSKQETNKIPSPENGNLRYADPTELMQQNPAALIVNRESYLRMAAHFDPGVFDPPQVVRVKAYSPDEGELERTFVIDGLTRVKYAHDHKGEAIPDYPDFKFDQLPVRDVTDSYLKNPAIVRGDTTNRKTLTMAEYLHAVVPPTAIHSEIATDRIAAHLINGWRNIVGEELAERFSAVAALSLTSNSTVNERMFQDYLNHQGTILHDETPSERTKLNEGLIEMVAVIREAKLRPQEVAKAAFGLVSLESSVIGGSKEAQRQVWGLLHTPEVQRKLREAFSVEGEQEQARAELGSLLIQVLQNAATDTTKQRSIDAYQKSLEDRDLHIDHVRRVFSADRPLSEYSTVKEDITEGRVKQEYMSAAQTRKLTDVEERLIQLVGRRQYIRPTDMPHVISAIKSATRLSESASEYIRQLSEAADELTGQGVTRELLEEVRRSVSIANVTLLREEDQGRGVDLAGSYLGLLKRTKDAERRLVSAKQRITRAVNAHKIGLIVDEVYGEEIQEGYGRQVRKVIIDHVLLTDSQFHEPTIRERIKKLQSLDPALQADVLQGTRRLDHALQFQAERNNPVASGSSQVEKSIQIVPTEEIPVAKSAVRAVTSALPQVPSVSRPPAPHVRADIFEAQQLTERRRREINNKKAVDLARNGRGSLRDIDLSREELTAEAREELMVFFNEMGSLLFGQPNSARIVHEYVRKIETDLQDFEAQVKQELDSSITETRTRQ